MALTPSCNTAIWCYTYQNPQVTKGQTKKAVVVETRYPTQRKNGAHFQFLHNSCVLLSDKGAPLGNKLRCLLPYEFNKPRWKKLASMSKRLF